MLQVVLSATIEIESVTLADITSILALNGPTYEELDGAGRLGHAPTTETNVTEFTIGSASMTVTLSR